MIILKALKRIIENWTLITDKEFDSVKMKREICDKIGNDMVQHTK